MLNLQIRKLFALPHELLHIAGYRLVGKQCRYEWGNFYVQPLGPMRLRERLVGLLFPFVIFTLSVIVCGLLSLFSYKTMLQGGSPWWFLGWTLAALIAGGYAGTTIGDLRKAYLLIVNKPWYSWTPFDLFFWPVVDWKEVRAKAVEREQRESQN